jgi:hypothetical protein
MPLRLAFGHDSLPLAMILADEEIWEISLLLRLVAPGHEGSANPCPAEEQEEEDDDDDDLFTLSLSLTMGIPPSELPHDDLLLTLSLEVGLPPTYRGESTLPIEDHLLPSMLPDLGLSSLAFTSFLHFGVACSLDL